MECLPVILLHNAEGKILLQYRDSGAPTMPLMWSFFGGRTEGNETPEQGIIREAEEELGIRLDVEQLVCLGREVHTEESTREIVVFTSAEPVTWEDIVVHEGAGAAFLSKEEILAMPNTTETAKYFVGKYIS